MSAPEPRRRTPGRKPALSREEVLAAALEVADAEGLDGLTMRRLGAALGVAPMGLYRYFRNKDELVAGLYDAALDAFDPGDHAAGTPRARLEDAFRWFRATLVAHPAVLSVAVRRAGLGRSSDRISEHVLCLLRELTGDDAEATRVFFALVSHTVGFAVLEGAAQAERERRGVEEPDEWLRQSHLRFAALPSDRFPSLVALAPHIAGYWTDEQFEDGIRRILDSLDR